jgi:hypothetical protein
LATSAAAGGNAAFFGFLNKQLAIIFGWNQGK